MKIAVNTRFLLPQRLEGFGWYTHEILRRMVQQHPADEFLFLFDRPFDPRFVYAPNVPPLVLFPPARHPLLWWLWFERAVPQALRRHGAEVFFS
ncbi:MAG TPA: glycosyltransferase family 1 protein, partial [Saprospiraceae bacterium]|nr:glycosyltransferase family 1 protein [Saprospiraceae bacterium]